MKVQKRDGKIVKFDIVRVENAIKKAFKGANIEITDEILKSIGSSFNDLDNEDDVPVQIEVIQDRIEKKLYQLGYYQVAKTFILYREKRKEVRSWTEEKMKFIDKYKTSSNTANATVDDNSNVGNKNIGILNSEIHKSDNILISRQMISKKLQELFPDFDYKQYEKDLTDHIIYKHDESSFAGAIAPYCCSITMYPFLLGGIKGIGGLSAKPKNLDSFCGMYINLIFATSAMFAGAVATSEFLLYFDYFARKEWGNDYYTKSDTVITTPTCVRQKTIESQIHQYFQQVIYSINQPAAARGLQSAFVNFSYFDKPFFEGMFGDFFFPDGTKPIWESLNWLQKNFMSWFNKERLKTIITFPVESFALVYQDGKFLDQENADFVAAELARGHSFFVYISDTVDSLSSCCFSGDTMTLTKSSSGVNWMTFKEIYESKWSDVKRNFSIFHNGSWVKGVPIKLPNRKMYKIRTSNNKEIIVSDNHLNPTQRGDIETKNLTTEDYLMFSTNKLDSYSEKDEGLTYSQGFTIGAFLGDGSFGTRINGVIYDINFSQNEQKYNKCIEEVNKANKLIGSNTECCLSSIYNNVYPVRISSKKLVAFIQKWTNWKEGTTYSNKELNMDCLLQSYEFRKGILDGWYNTDGGNSNRCYTTSEKLAKCMEVLITSLGMNSIIDYSDRTDEKVVIRDKEYNRNYPLYCVRWYDPKNKRSMKDIYKFQNNSIYFKITSIEETDYSDDIYCFEMKNSEEPYFTLPNGIITHNCRLKNMVQTKEFNFTNGNMGVQTGSKSVITLNLNRIIQNKCKLHNPSSRTEWKEEMREYLINILDRVYKYHTAYNELLWDIYNSDLLPVYKAGFIDLNKQYLTIGLNGLNQAAEFLGIKCNDNEIYSEFCQFIFSTIKEQNILHKTKKLTFNTEQVPAESLAIKNYNWDKADGYWVPDDTNLYASYVFKPNDPKTSVLEKLRLHGKNYIGEYLDGGAAAHINLSEHLSEEQYQKLLKYAAEVGCQYFTFNIPNSECNDCGYITKVPLEECPKCHSHNISMYDRVIGYLSKISNWSDGRQKEQETRVYSKDIDND